jgi:phosphoserine phosphatase
VPIVRLLSDPAGLEARLDRLRKALAPEGIQLADARLLEHEGRLAELALTGGEPRHLATMIADLFEGSNFLVTADVPRVPDLLVCDMDSTMIGQECIDELADYAGLKDEVAALTERAMRGDLDFAAALHERVALLAGLSEKVIAECLAQRIVPQAGARALVATLSSRGTRCVLVTGGFHHFADAVARTIGFDHVVANRLAVAQGRLTGKLIGPIRDAATKRRVLEEERAKLGAGAVTAALGDGANDALMLQAADYGLSVRAKPVAAAAANGRIDGGDLRALLELLHIPRTDWVAS